TDYCYMRNVLLMAYRSDCDNESRLEGCNSWRSFCDEVAKLHPPKRPDYLQDTKGSYGRRFAFSRIAPETLACLVLDALTTGGGIAWDVKNVDGLVTFPSTLNLEMVMAEFQSLHELMWTHVWYEGPGEDKRDRLKD